MSFMIFLQIFADIVFTAGLFVAFARLRRSAKDDPRLSKGLQLLSSKISVLEDLSDRTETQVQQMLLLLDQKSRELQSKIALADRQVAAVRQSMDQSLEVAQIFQDKIPHSEIIERQNSVKYIRAARLAHAGASVDDIVREVDLPIGEIEFISKVNQDSLSFREEDLPAWAKEPVSPISENISSAAGFIEDEQTIPPRASEIRQPKAQLNSEQEGLVQRLSKLQFEMKNLDLELAHRSARNVMPDMTQAFSQPSIDSTSLERLGEEFRRAVEAAEHSQRSDFSNEISPEKSLERETAVSKSGNVTINNEPIARKVTVPELEAARGAAAALRTHENSSSKSNKSDTKKIRRVEFPRI